MAVLNRVGLWALLVIGLVIQVHGVSVAGTSTADVQLKNKIIGGDSQFVKTYLHRSGNPDIRIDRIGNTPLIVAARQGKEEIVRLLVEDGANVSRENDKGLNPLVTAVASGHRDIVRYLIEHGADVNYEPNVAGDKLYLNLAPPLLLAGRLGYEDIVEDLLKAGAKVGIQDERGQTALLQSSCHCKPKMIELLVREGADLNERDRKGWTPLMCAAWNGCSKAVRVLIREGARTDLKHIKDGTALTELARSTSHPDTLPKLAKLLIRNGANVNHYDSDYRTPLYSAVKNENTSLAKVLLKKGADSHFRKGVEVSPWQAALRSRHTGLIKVFLKFGIPYGSLSKTERKQLLDHARRTGDEELVKLLKKRGIDFSS